MELPRPHARRRRLATAGGLFLLSGSFSSASSRGNPALHERRPLTGVASEGFKHERSRDNETTCLSLSEHVTGGRSTLSVGWKDTVPSQQHWARCSWCRARSTDSRFLVELFRGAPMVPLEAEHDQEGPVLLSRSRWHGFFHHASEEVWGDILDVTFDLSTSCARLEDRPVFILPVLTWQVGHLFIDVLEPLYRTMMDRFGHINRDVLLYVEVSKREEREVFADNLRHSLYEADSPFRMLQLFTRHPIRTVTHFEEEIRRSGDRLCFRDLHLGLDITGTYVAHGNDRWAQGMDPQELSLLGDSEGEALAMKYGAFRDFLWEGLGLGKGDAVLRPRGEDGEGERVVIVERRGKRRVLNSAELTVAARMALGPKTLVTRVHLEDMTFTEQLQILQSATVLVSAYGTGLHNSPLVRPGAALVLLMQPAWCPWRWHYTLQARLSGLRALTYCHGEGDQAQRGYRFAEERRYRWAERSWLQGPWYSKDLEFTVEMPVVRDLLRGLVPSLSGAHNETSSQEALDGPVVTSWSPSQPSLQHTVEQELPPIRAHMTLEGVLEVGTEVVSLSQVVYKIKVVPEIIVARSYQALLGEGLYLMCTEVFVVPERHATEGDMELASPEPLCRGEEAFNEFSTLDLEAVLGGSYVLHAWLVHRDTHTLVRGSDAWLAFSSTRRKESLNPLIFEPSDVATVHVRTGGSSSNSSDPPDAIARQLHIRLAPETAMSLDVVRHCRDLDLGVAECALLAHAASEQAWEKRRILLEALPASQRGAPSPERPFIFYHLEKSGGSTLRAHLARSALSRCLGFFVPCYDNEHARLDRTYLSCYKWDIKSHVSLEDRSRIAVLAGHFAWGVRHELPSIQQPSSSLAPEPPLCFTVLRDPIERVISLYYERAYPFTRKDMNDLAQDELEFLLVNFYGSAFSRFRDEGMSNAACKMFCNAHTHHGLDPFADPQPPAAQLDVAMARQRLSSCVVGLQGDWEGTKRVLRRWAPWLEVQDSVRENTGNWEAERADSLRPELRDLIVQYNDCDIELYRLGLTIFARQMELLNIETTSRVAV